MPRAPAWRRQTLWRRRDDEPRPRPRMHRDRAPRRRSLPSPVGRSRVSVAIALISTSTPFSSRSSPTKTRSVARRIERHRLELAGAHAVVHHARQRPRLADLGGEDRHVRIRFRTETGRCGASARVRARDREIRWANSNGSADCRRAACRPGWRGQHEPAAHRRRPWRRDREPRRRRPRRRVVRHARSLSRRPARSAGSLRSGQAESRVPASGPSASLRRAPRRWSRRRSARRGVRAQPVRARGPTTWRNRPPTGARSTCRMFRLGGRSTAIRN